MLLWLSCVHIGRVLRANMTKARGDFAAEALPGGRVIVMGGETTNGTATGKHGSCAL